jgi:hypothetical protein
LNCAPPDDITAGLKALAAHAHVPTGTYAHIGRFDPPEWLFFVGRFHPTIVHFPIGLLILAALLEACAASYRPLRTLRHATRRPHRVFLC